MFARGTSDYFNERRPMPKTKIRRSSLLVDYEYNGALTGRWTINEHTFARISSFFVIAGNAHQRRIARREHKRVHERLCLSKKEKSERIIKSDFSDMERRVYAYMSSKSLAPTHP